MKKILGVLMIGIILVGSVGCGRPGADADAIEEINKIAVKTETIVTDTIRETFYGVGEMKAKDEYEVMTGQSGTIEGVFVEVGDRVKKGQVLMKLENTSLITTVNNNESALRTQMNINKIQLDDAKTTYDQKKSLFDAGAVSQKEMDTATNSLDQLQLNYDNSTNNYNLTMRNLNADIADTSVKSPIDGVVAAKYVDVKQDVQNSVAFKVVNSSVMVAVIDVPENIVSSIKVGQSALVYMNGDNENGIQGTVVTIDGVPGANSFLYPVEIQIDNMDSKLRSGMYIEAEIVLSERLDQVVIPKDALLGTDTDKYVYIEVDGISEKRSVEIGFNESKMIEVLSGLKAGEQLIVRGQDYLKEGDTVNIVE